MAQLKTTTINGTLTVTGNICVPTGKNKTYYIGSSSLMYKGIYAETFTGNLTGNVTGNVTGNLTGDVTGNVTATTLSGALTGNVTGNLTGNVTGNLTGDVTGNVSGNAGSADKLKLSKAVGGASTPVYFSSDGVPIACDYTIQTSVPVNAVFTDTTYSAGTNISIDANNKISATDTTYSTVSKTAAGLCPILPNETTTTKYLRQDGTWTIPPNDNTTYTFTNKDATLKWNEAVTIATVGGTDIKVKLPANPDTNTWPTTYLVGASVSGQTLTVTDNAGNSYSLTNTDTNTDTNTTYAPGTNITITGSNNAINVTDSPKFSGTVTAACFAGSSDYRLKENIRLCETDYSSIVENIPVYLFNYISDETKRTFIGTIAQTLRDILPQEMRDAFIIGEEGENSFLSLTDAKIVYLLIGAFKEESSKRKEVERTVEDLKYQNDQLRRDVEMLKSMVFDLQGRLAE